MQVLRVAIITVFFASFGLIGISAQEHAAPSLAAGETNFYTDTVETSLAEPGPVTEFIRTELRELDPKVGIEISIPIAVTDEVFTESGMLQLYNILRRVSTMEGLEYYSASRDEMRTFYHESYAIDDPDSQRRIPDPTVSSIPSRDTIHVFQQDGSFGKNVQRIEYRADGPEILLSMVNTTTMVYKIVPLVTPGNLRTFLVVRPVPEDGVVTFYGNLGVRVPGLFGMKDRARDSFYNRIVALHDWFAAEQASAGLTSD
ncbi:MAG: hypothetical protein PF508_10905 [Spirochaeta sp.]|jgi:hypothetical protein|nr:hypothetical protein [Spirochaeta sp.]